MGEFLMDEEVDFGLVDSVSCVLVVAAVVVEVVGSLDLVLLDSCESKHIFHR